MPVHWRQEKWNGGSLIKALLAAAVTLCYSPAFAQNWVANPASQFCGLNVTSDSGSIPDCDTPDAQNVFTDDGGLEKRTGNVRLATILDGYSVKYAREFIAPSSTRYLVAHVSTSVYQTNLSGSAVAVSTVAADSNIDIAIGFGKAVVQDGSGVAWSWDGVSSASISGMPVCNLLVFGDERFYCANIPSQSSARVAVSSFGSSSYFTVPANVASIGDAPNTFDFQKDDGEAITCFEATPWGKFIGKPHSTHILKGYDNLTYYKKLIDPRIGCVDDRSVQMVDGLLVWLSYDGIYAWSGTGPPQLLTKDIESVIKGIRQVNSAAAQWVVSTQADFEEGTITGNGPTASWDTDSVPGSIFPSSTTFVDTSTTNFSAGTLSNLYTSNGELFLSSRTAADTFADGDFTAGVTTWSATSGSFDIETFSGVNFIRPLTSADDAGDLIHSTNLLNVSSGTWRFTHRFSNAACASANGRCLIYWFQKSGNNSYSVQILRVGSGHQVQIVKTDAGTDTVLTDAPVTLAIDTNYVWTMSKNADGSMWLYQDGVQISSSVDTAVTASGEVGIGISAPASASVKNYIGQIFVHQFYSYASIVSRVFDTQFSTPIYGVASATVTLPSSGNGNIAFYTQTSTATDGGGFNTLATTSDTLRVTSAGIRGFRYKADFTIGTSTTAPSLSDISFVAKSSGNYYSSVHFIGTAITSWRAFNATDDQAPSGLLAYYVRSATYSFAANATIPAWSAQTNNVTITISTSNYFQFRIDSSEIDSSSQTVQVYRAATNWQEGVSYRVASGVIDHRYFLCAGFSATATANDKCLVLQKNNEWVYWVGPSLASMERFNEQLIAGDGSTSGKVWELLQDDVYQDDGDAIDAYWVSKDFSLDRPFQEKILHEVWIDAARVSASTMTVGYAVNKGTDFVSKSFPLGDVSNYMIKRVSLAAGYALGYYLKFKFSNSTIDQFFRLNSYLFLTETKDRKTNL